MFHKKILYMAQFLTLRDINNLPNKWAEIGQ